MFSKIFLHSQTFFFFFPSLSVIVRAISNLLNLNFPIYRFVIILMISYVNLLSSCILNKYALYLKPQKK